MIETKPRTKPLTRDEEGNVVCADLEHLRTETARSRRISREVDEHRREIIARNVANGIASGTHCAKCHYHHSVCELVGCGVQS